jgi:hypothetical protein
VDESAAARLGLAMGEVVKEIETMLHNAPGPTRPAPRARPPQSSMATPRSREGRTGTTRPSTCPTLNWIP